MTTLTMPAAVRQFGKSIALARIERVEALCREALEGTPPASRWRIHLVQQQALPSFWTATSWMDVARNRATFTVDPDPGVACWLGDFPPGHDQ